MENLVIREYLPEDKEEARKLHEVALRATGAYFEGGNWNDDFNDIEGVYLKTGGEFIVGSIDGKIVAMGALKKVSDDIAEVKRMRISPDFQKQGLGQKIYDELEKRARAKGFKKLVLDTTPQQIAALGFYPKNGFKETRRKQEADWEMIFMEKEL